jgi:hypothetical protein
MVMRAMRDVAEDVWRMYGGCMGDVWGVYGGCMEDVRKMRNSMEGGFDNGGWNAWLI